MSNDKGAVLARSKALRDALESQIGLSHLGEAKSGPQGGKWLKVALAGASQVYFIGPGASIGTAVKQ